MKVKQDRQEGDSVLFLHRLGYNFFNLNRLTYSEINALIDAHNRDIEKQEREAKKNRK